MLLFISDAIYLHFATLVGDFLKESTTANVLNVSQLSDDHRRELGGGSLNCLKTNDQR